MLNAPRLKGVTGVSGVWCLEWWVTWEPWEILGGIRRTDGWTIGRHQVPVGTMTTTGPKVRLPRRAGHIHTIPFSQTSRLGCFVVLPGTGVH